MISIALCDDETKYLDFYEAKIKEIAIKNRLLIDVVKFKTGESFLFYLEDNPNKFDIIYLDILIGSLTGIDIALKLREFNEYAKIIFLTSSESYVYNSFEAKPTNYLIKNIHDEKFEEVFLSTVKSINKSLSKEIIRFKNQKEEITFNLSDITYIESLKRLIIVHTIDKKTYEFYYKLSDLTQELESKDFILIHRSFLINLGYIKKILKDEVVLKNDISLPISRNLATSVKSKYISYLNQ